MPMTPSKRFRLKKEAELQALKEKPDNQPTGNAYELMLIQLTDHKKRLKEIQSIERKIEVKTEILPDYIPYIDGIISADKGAQDEVVMTVMLWRIDIGDIIGALEIAEYALAHDLKTPERFNRDTATLIAEEVAEIALKSESPDTEQLLKTFDMTSEKDMPDEVRAKLHKATGLAFSETDLDESISHLKRAYQLHEKCGVVKIIEKLEREQKKLADKKPEPNAPANTAD